MTTLTPTILAWPDGWTVYASTQYGVTLAISDTGREATMRHTEAGVVVVIEDGEVFTRYTFGDACRHLEAIGPDPERTAP